MVFGIILPWILGAYLYCRHPLLVLTVAPFASVISFVINAAEFVLGVWNLKPFMRIETLSAYPFDLGLYPVLGCWCMILIQRFGRIVTTLIAFALGTTPLEGFVIAIGHDSYGNVWNLAWTFVSYLVVYIAAFQYSRLLQSILAEYGQTTGRNFYV